ncbi:hypothetical protein J1N35_035088 [Gossypium stocksii]|uniref:SWIM-type domain-containing protein n=1 Tax=Gossypium stocksii TaxID=47602 RepID=A0A9D3ZQR8_9ROSI|nr:hypothetical protein J1N35_035088 [Gossypium stocksii]
MFWTFDLYVHVFLQCKPFVQVDGTWLYKKYTQFPLLVVAHDDNKNMLPIAFAIIDKEKIESLGTLMPRMGQQQVNQIETRHVFVEDVRDTMVANHRMTRWCDCRRFQTLHYPCAHVVATCAKVSLNVEQFFYDVYILERMLRVRENKFPVLLDLSTWEVPPTTFELVPNKGLRRNLKGCPQSSKIHNKIDIREKSNGKRFGLYRLTGHNRSKCPQRNYHNRQSSQSGRN